MGLVHESIGDPLETLYPDLVGSLSPGNTTGYVLRKRWDLKEGEYLGSQSYLLEG